MTNALRGVLVLSFLAAASHAAPARLSFSQAGRGLEKNTTTQTFTFNVAIIENPSAPMACRSLERCWPTSRNWSRSSCRFNGIRTVSGMCVHGVIPDLLNIISDASNRQIRWRVTLLADPRHREDYDAAVMEVTEPGKVWGKVAGNEHMCDGEHCHLLASDITITSVCVCGLPLSQHHQQRSLPPSVLAALTVCGGGHGRQ